MTRLRKQTAELCDAFPAVAVAYGWPEIGCLT